MSFHLRVVLAQLNFMVGDVFGNAEKIIEAMKEARDALKADIIVFPELALSGYPPEDLLHRSHFLTRVDDALKSIKKEVSGIDVILGYPERTEKGIFNSAVWFRDHNVFSNYRKQELPNYSVFDEYRYFVSGNNVCIGEIKGIKCAILICEDMWTPTACMGLKQAGIECIFCLNSSPYSIHKAEKRLDILKKRVDENASSIFYVNTVGGQDELVFDGGSQVIDAKGEVCAHAGFFNEKLLPIDIDSNLNIVKQSLSSGLVEEASIYQALTLGVKDYISKNNFDGVILGVSGGVDSALTLTIAVDALGADKVTALFMPSPYTSQMSRDDAQKLAETLGVTYHTLSIDKLFTLFLEELKEVFSGTEPDVTEENIQARIRGVLLMALSNKMRKIVLSTGNKSEMSVGYSTLYGDMVGGFCVLKDVFKTTVYALAQYRNRISPVIPERIISRAPSAELAPDQKDQDLLPPYEELDQILKLFIEYDLGIPEIIEKGFDDTMVRKIITMVVRNEYKRRQSPPGIRISEKAFGRDRRYPITSGYLG